MAVKAEVHWRGVSVEQYEAARARVNWEGSPPDGGIFHVCCVDGADLRITDVWESPDQMQAFVESRLMPAVKELGIESEPEVTITDAHAVFTPALSTA